MKGEQMLNYAGVILSTDERRELHLAPEHWERKYIVREKTRGGGKHLLYTNSFRRALIFLRDGKAKKNKFDYQA